MKDKLCTEKNAYIQETKTQFMYRIKYTCTRNKYRSYIQKQIHITRNKYTNYIQKQIHMY